MLISAAIVPIHFFVVNDWCKALGVEGSTGLIETKSIDMTYLITFFLVFAGFAVAYVDDRLGKKYVARNVDLPFAFSIFVSVMDALFFKKFLRPNLA